MCQCCFNLLSKNRFCNRAFAICVFKMVPEIAKQVLFSVLNFSEGETGLFLLKVVRPYCLVPFFWVDEGAGSNYRIGIII